MALDATRSWLPASDSSAAELIKGEYGDGWLNYAVGTGTWYTWTGQCHEPDDSGSVSRIVIGLGWRLRDVLGAARQAVSARVARDLSPDATEASIRQARKQAWEPWEAAEKYAAGLLKAAGQTALLTVLSRVCGCSDEYMGERNQGFLNFANGTLNLATLELRPHRMADMITYVLPDAWDASARCPRFWNVLYRMTGCDYDVTCFLVKVLGYCLLGDNREQKVFFINGPTGSGKSVVLYITGQVLGPLAHSSQPELITVVRHGRNARSENSIRGKRFIPITETSSYMNIDEAQLKRLTGEPMISVNQHYSKTELKTLATWTIIVATNQMPTLTNFDAAMRRRVVVIPGGPTVPEWDVNTGLAASILSTERAGILALLARGCREYFRTGLAMPDLVRQATEEYAAEQNTVAQFVQDTMVIGGWGEGIVQADAWTVYRQWARGTSHLGRNEFYDHMKKHPGMSYNEQMRRFENVAWNESYQGYGDVTKTWKGL